MSGRFMRTAMIIGPEGLEKLKASSVAVFGLGGVGSFAAEALARSGVGNLVLIDHDVVALTNLNRQLVALENTIGRPKVEVMAERIGLINPDAGVLPRQIFCTPENRHEVLGHGLSYVVDAIDTITSKIDLIMGCLETGIPCISSMGTGNKLDPTRFRVADISETHTDRLAKVIRTELRKKGIHRGIKVVFSDEEPAGSADIGETAEVRPSGRPVPGSISFVPPVAGMILASVVVRDLLAKPASGGGDA